MKETLKSAEETKVFARRFVFDLKPRENTATIIGLYGDLGSGKTNFTQAVADSLGVTENVASPTFVIMKIYELTSQKWKHLIHVDAYRLEKSSELLHLGWKSIINNPENLILIEWPEKVADIMPEHIRICFTHVSESERGVEIIINYDR